MNFLLYLCFLGPVLVQRHILAESGLTLTASPGTINPGQTAHLIIRCAVADNSGTESGLTHVTSIAVSRMNTNTGANESVATMTSFGPPTAHQDLGKLKVQGNITGTEPYLELTWANPSAHQVGRYSCEVSGLNSGQHPETITGSLQVLLTQPSTEELLLYIADLDSRTEAIENRLSGAQGGNIQTGIIVCTQGTHDFPVVFNEPYKRVPTVVAALSGTKSVGGFVYPPRVIVVSSTGFTLRCTSNEDISVVWVAI